MARRQFPVMTDKTSPSFAFRATTAALFEHGVQITVSPSTSTLSQYPHDCTPPSKSFT